MANVLTTNPIILDTAGATSLIARPLRIRTIVWYGATTAAHTIRIHDASGGNIIFGANARVADETIVVTLDGIRVTGLYLTTLDSGTVLVYLR